MSTLVYTVYLTDQDGKLHTFGPGSDVPEWARRAIDNSLAWDTPPSKDEELVFAASEDHGESVASPAAEPPPQGGPGASRKVWADWAADHKVAVEDDWKRDDIIAACKKAGVPV